MAAYGLRLEDSAQTEDSAFYLWPENLPAWQLFHACTTQWRTSMAGREGLDYSGVQVVLAEHHVPRRQRRQRFCEIQLMETVALQVWANERDKNP